MSNLNMCPLTPSETYSDDDRDNLKSPVYTTPSVVSEVSNGSSETNENTTNYNYEINQFGQSTGHLNDAESDQNLNFYNNPSGFNFQIQQYLANNPQNYESYQQGINNELVQPYSVANFDLCSTRNYKQEADDQVNNSNQYQKEIVEPARQSPKETQDTKPAVFSTDYLLRPPDSESIAAAAVTARKNRNKRRTRIKFDQEQLDLLEASFQRTHYPDVNIVDRLSELLNIKTDKICIWFQNRRARFKKQKKLPGEVKDEPSFPDFQNKPIDLIESAHREITERRKQTEKIESPKSDYNETVNSKQSENTLDNSSRRTSENFNDTQSNGCFLPTESTQGYTSESYQKQENQLYEQNQDSQAYEPKQETQVYQQHTQNQPQFNHQAIFRPHLMDHNQFYQPEIKTEFNANYYDHQNRLPTVPANQNRVSMSSSSSDQSRSVSPESESSASPDTPEESQEPADQQDFNQNQQYAELQTQDPSNFSNYPYLQPGTLPPSYGQQGYYNNSYRQSYVSPPLPAASSIFQPYIDCNTRPAPAYIQNTPQYYQSYYNQ